MIFLEALSFQTPVLTGPLEYGVLDDHPYRELTEVFRADSIYEIEKAGQRVLDEYNTNKNNLLSLMSDFRTQMLECAYKKYEHLIDK
jgi:hypothetical protein